MTLPPMSIEVFKEKVISLLGSEEAFKRSALRIRDGAGVFDRVLGGAIRYHHLLEIGTYRGIAAAYCSQFVDRISTVDLKFGRLEQLGTPFDREAFWASMGVTNITLHLLEGRSPSELLLEKSMLIGQLDFDIAFIDGGKVDIATDFALVRRCGTVLFHDVDKRPGNIDPVYDFVMRLPPQQVERMDIFALWKG